MNASHGCYRPPTPRDIEVRLLRPDDADGLMVLEEAKWTREQAGSRESLVQRIENNPKLCVGAFSATTGKVLTSLFAKPITAEKARTALSWRECADAEAPHPRASRSLFGISLSSIDGDAVTAVFEFFLPHALALGYHDIYLGSPLPGLYAWKRANPEVPVGDYVYAKRNGLPLDPQLRYYHGKGFQSIVACKSDYFPHERSLDHAAVIRGDIPDLILALPRAADPAHS
ncbi:hypothetical protein [Streptomyces spongiae]|uniref:GNAT family N-acetyltransferase n=1 Tax=Streptomyces spongiae TaxID=565072 RepID=A0A5N8XYF1_9ACTN|nr:hypothetical protein [Streptomyces spongiae]MPY63735.1 hypothetical protein [Streptomyces spongiae]